jgi:hypothetical protein
MSTRLEPRRLVIRSSKAAEGHSCVAMLNDPFLASSAVRRFFGCGISPCQSSAKRVGDCRCRRDTRETGKADLAIHGHRAPSGCSV